MIQRSRKTLRQAERRGFTLIEILVVVAVMSILVALMMGVSKEVITQSKIKETRTKLATLSSQAEKYKEAFGGFPGGRDQNGAPVPAGNLAAAILALGNEPANLVGKEFYSGGFIDSWGNPILYYYTDPPGSIDAKYNDVFLQNNRVPVLVSGGPTGVLEDDITMPERK